ncbi:MAG UNVERIFIED_CONTAM: glycosyltransferase [Anaerolineae bacterium]|jgi:hypothetical protein
MGALENPLIISLAKQLERLAYRHATSIVALSPGMKDGVLREGIEAERVTVIPNSSDVELFNIVPDNPKWIHQRLGIPVLAVIWWSLPARSGRVKWGKLSG